MATTYSTLAERLSQIEESITTLQDYIDKEMENIKDYVNNAITATLNTEV